MVSKIGNYSGKAIFYLIFWNILFDDYILKYIYGNIGSFYYHAYFIN